MREADRAAAVAALQISEVGLDKFANVDALNPEIVAQARAASIARIGGVAHVAGREQHGPKGFER